MNIDELKAAVTAAWEAERSVDNEFQVALVLARSTVVSQWEERIKTAKRALSKAEADLRDAISASATHEWEGRKVYRMEKQGSNWQKLPDKPIYGFVEVRRIGTQFPGNLAGHSMPRMGDAFVRLAKADGKPVMKIERLAGMFGGSNWKLVEEAAA